MELLEVDHEAGDEAVVVRVKGDVDSSTVDQLIAQLADALGLARAHPTQLLIVDLQPVTFFGSAGLNAVLGCHEQGRAAGTSVRLVAANGQVLQPIQVTELDRIFDIYPTLSDALQGSKPGEDSERPQ
ncbi:MAG: anti-sigma factor antagonist [Mycobacterium sp.]|jgi:anti-anti-sigma factor|nr:anti-sigma factor antagonist [Mycobacterium sp.]